MVICIEHEQKFVNRTIQIIVTEFGPNLGHVVVNICKSLISVRFFYEKEPKIEPIRFYFGFLFLRYNGIELLSKKMEFVGQNHRNCFLSSE